MQNYMRYRNLFTYALCILLSCSESKYSNPHVVIQTRLGDIELELYRDKAPKTVSAFLMFVDSGLYKNTTFYRVLNMDNQPSDSYKAELIQGGLWKTKYSKSAGLKGIPHETTKQTGIVHTDGVISLARQEPGTATTEFFICIGDQRGFDYEGLNNPDKQGYAAFGKVVKGLDIVKRIYKQPEDEQAFEPPVDIYNIVRL